MNLVDTFYYSQSFNQNDSEALDLAKRKALSTVIPRIIENELTDKQSVCFRFKYINNMTQTEIAKKLGISQPTVSRHINSARDILNDELKYCYAATEMALTELERSYLY